MRASASPNPASFRLPSSSLPPKRPGLLPSPPTFLPKSRFFFSKSLAGGDRSPPKEQSPKTKLDHRNQAHAGREEEDRHVRCEVDVVSWRERRIKARILVDADVETVWSVLTDYECLADFIPNLVYSGRIPCPHQGRIWLEQRGLQRALYWHIEARVVLDLQELPDSANGRELHFSMVDGDFKKFEGKWSVKAGPRSSTAFLSYEVNVIPRFNFPAIFLERIIRSDLPVNLGALACRAVRNSEENKKMLITRNSAGASCRSSNPPSLDLSDAACETDALSSNKLKEDYASSAFSTMLGSPSTEFNSKWGVYGKVCRLDRRCMVDEVHLRRFDGLLENGGAHRCVIASITVKAPIREVWNVLTTYEALPEIVPNLAISKILYRDNNKVRILQEGCKGLLYMVLHARVVLDLHEELEHEISFEQVEGDFDSFQGKWLLEQLGDQHTLLKYIVESKMHKDTFLSEAILEEVIYEDLPSNLCAIRDFVEEREAAGNEPPKYPDRLVVPVSNCVRVTESKPVKQVSTTDVLAAPLRQRPKVPGLQTDIEVLKAELMSFISRYGQDGFMPMRKQLRMHGRVDIEKAITRMGGFRKIANLMNLSLAYKHRKPSGYWDNLENLQEEVQTIFILPFGTNPNGYTLAMSALAELKIRRFQKNWGMDLAYMPSRKSFERAGRYDIARALEKWGGLQEVSRLLSLKLRHPRRHLDFEREGQHDFKASGELDGEEKIPSKPYIPQDTEKWLMKLKDLDINWVE